MNNNCDDSDASGKDCDELILWILSTDISLSVCLTLLIFFILVLLSFSGTATFNKLTLWPYYFMMGFSVSSILQFVFSTLQMDNGTKAWLILINLTRTFTLYTAIGIQIFEWFNTYLQIMF